MKAAVIGGGVIGLAVADELTRRGIEVELLERSPSLGLEASSAAAGILAPHSEADDPGPFLDLLLAASQQIPETVHRLETQTGLLLGHRISGMLSLAFSDQQQRKLEESYEWQADAGLGPEKLEPAAVRKLEPAVDGPVQGCVYWPQTSVLDPRQLVRAYEQSVRSQSGKIRLGTAAQSVLIRNGRAYGVQTSAGPVEADWVVHCAGPWAAELTGLPFSVPTVPARGQILQFATEGPLFRSVVKSDAAYLVQRSGDCLIAGTTLEYAGFDKNTTEEGKRSISEGVKQISSKAGALRLQESWAGLRPDSPDHLPILGSTPVSGLLMAAGHFRNGVLLAPLTGRLIADLVLGVRSAVDLVPFGISRFQR